MFEMSPATVPVADAALPSEPCPFADPWPKHVVEITSSISIVKCRVIVVVPCSSFDLSAGQRMAAGHGHLNHPPWSLQLNGRP
jgi:hypothetical protein